MQKQSWDGEWILRVEKLTKRYGGRTAVKEVSFSIGYGECFGLVGRSGCGKTTLANVLSRLQMEDSGEIYFKGRRIDKAYVKKTLNGEIQMVFQNSADSFDPRDTVRSGILQGIYGKRKKDGSGQLTNMLKLVGLPEEYAKKKVRDLSGGECQRVGIARALIGQPSLLICDEPTSALDPIVQMQMVDLIRKQKEEGISLLLITHDLRLAELLCDRLAVMEEGRIAEITTPKALRNAPESEAGARLVRKFFG